MTNNGKQRWIFWLVGTITTIIIISITTLSANVIANDKDSRKRDIEITKLTSEELKELRGEITKEFKEMGVSQTQVLIAIAEIKKDIQKIR